MKMDSIRIIGSSSITLPVAGESTAGPFVLRGAEGLGPPEVNVKFARTTLEQAVYQGKSPSLRQIVLVIGIAPDWNSGQTVEELRTQLYSLLSPNSGIKIRLDIMHAMSVQGYAQGHISKFEVGLFTANPAVQITLECDYPYFIHPFMITQSPGSTPYGGNREFIIQNSGTAPSGFRAGFVIGNAIDTSQSLVLSTNNPLGPKLQIDGVAFASGDEFILDTRSGSRGVWKRPSDGSMGSILNNMNASVSEWVQLHGGDNVLRLNVSGFSWVPTINFQHQPAYWGV